MGKTGDGVASICGAHYHCAGSPGVGHSGALDPAANMGRCLLAHEDRAVGDPTDSDSSASNPYADNLCVFMASNPIDAAACCTNRNPVAVHLAVDAAESAASVMAQVALCKGQCG